MYFLQFINELFIIYDKNASSGTNLRNCNEEQIN